MPALCEIQLLNTTEHLNVDGLVIESPDTANVDDRIFKLRKS